MQLYVCEPHIVDVEIDISNGLHAFSIVGLPDKATEEAKDRISAAIKNSGFPSPKSKNQKLVISLAPAEIRKEGANFDLAMALAYLLSTSAINFDPKDKVFLGELSLDGSVRPIKGALPLIIGAKKKGIKEIFIPYQNKDEVLMVEDILIFPVSHLQEVAAHLNNRVINKSRNKENKEKEGRDEIVPLDPLPFVHSKRPIDIDFKDIKGQEGAKRALEIAAAGGHNIMMYGPPGTGKTMLARAFPYLLPNLSFDEMLEVTAIHSSVKHEIGIITHPPFRAPHHSASFTSIVGGGSFPRPGEVTLAHKGVLFMDEFPEFDLRVIDSLRQPLEDKSVIISRAKSSIVFPSDFILVASMNPCPCGFRGSRVKECICSVAAIQRYQRKLSGPIVDRIDIWIEVSEIDYKKLGAKEENETTESMRRRIVEARTINEKKRSESLLSDSCRKLLDTSAKALALSARAYYKVAKLARTIADLDGKENVEESHILEALQYRPRILK